MALDFVKELPKIASIQKVSVTQSKFELDTEIESKLGKVTREGLELVVDAALLDQDVIQLVKVGQADGAVLELVNLFI